ncbi:MAG: hypothetical protein R3304_01755 [Longimicrobiales bacterium]|nr:hypothetical protein [Longimicrobiales bacterium]
MDTVEGPHPFEPFVLRHEPAGRSPAPAGPSLSGHLHPVVKLRGPGGDRIRAPCFWVKPGEIVLPSFGGLTGGAEIRPHAVDRIFAVGDDAVVEVPLAGVRPGAP